MGTWGTAIFSDDTASDVRSDYRDYVGDGLSGTAATDRVVNEWRETLRDPDEGPVFWLALAATQWECGRLESRVRDKALEVIASGSGLRRWAEDPKLLTKRKSVLVFPAVVFPVTVAIWVPPPILGKRGASSTRPAGRDRPDASPRGWLEGANAEC